MDTSLTALKKTIRVWSVFCYNGNNGERKITSGHLYQVDNKRLIKVKVIPISAFRDLRYIVQQMLPSKMSNFLPEEVAASVAKLWIVRAMPLPIINISIEFLIFHYCRTSGIFIRSLH